MSALPFDRYHLTEPQQGFQQKISFHKSLYIEVSSRKIIQDFFL